MEKKFVFKSDSLNIGMTTEEVVKALGQPRRVVKEMSTSGTKYLWNYGDTILIIRDNKVVFVNDTLSF